MAANFCVYYAVWAMLGTYLTKELGWTPAQVAVPVFWGNILTFVACSFWGAVSESVGRRWALMIPTIIALFLIPLYITQVDRTLFLGFFLLFICFFSGKDALNPGWLSERFPTEVRATAVGVHLSPGRGLGRGRRADPDLLRGEPGHGFRQADDVRHDRFAGRVYHRGLSGAGNQGQGHDRRSGSDRGRSHARIASTARPWRVH